MAIDENIKLEIKELVDSKISGAGRPEDIINDVIYNNELGLTINESYSLLKWLRNKYLNKLGAIQDFVNGNDINEIMVNGINDIFIESRGKISKTDANFDEREDLDEVIRYIAAKVHREINEMNPILDARLENGSRVNAVLSNVALDGPVLTIRKFSNSNISMEDMVNSGSLSWDCLNVLKILVKCGYNIFVSGGTSSGKTTLLNALADFIPKEERVIIIEDSRELKMHGIDNIVQMECHNANSSGKGKVTMTDLIKTSLRMRPDRLIVGEVRGGEVADMLQAMNTGHYSMSTGHGNSIKGMLRRLEAMYLMSATIPMDAIRAQITEGVDIMIHLMRNSKGERKIMEVSELLGFKDGEYQLNDLFLRNGEGILTGTGNRLINRNRLLNSGVFNEEHGI